MCGIIICRCADVPTLPIVRPIVDPVFINVPLASVHALDIVREEEEEKGEQQSALS